MDNNPVSLSVIVVSDYAAGEEKSWEDLRRALRAWGEQEGTPADEFILVESSRFKGRIPSDVLGMIPNMTILYLDADSSYELKNLAVEAANGEWLAIVDADCIPQRSWLRVLRAAIVEYPDVAPSAPRPCIPVAHAWSAYWGSCPDPILIRDVAAQLALYPAMPPVFDERSFVVIPFPLPLAPSRREYSLRPFFGITRRYCSTLGWWWSMISKGGRWSGTYDVTMGTVPSSLGCAITGFRMRDWSAPVSLPFRSSWQVRHSTAFVTAFVAFASTT